ncbi:xanthine dehydrogenase family protein subunit M [Actinobacteria bacterium YIM 96077]|uniref:Xanthine dehydrogenase family protein subunit M n=1 Tax=Phytoactinopolyspora halophila TaxID=1981511 RepID=A0A329QR86_9ACTN|nr:xanthine dehydrogenase family protein subunit M [Phytoactinopolyspora halophila]AYY12954.1 xanthine dehydrogenase family protein subunit M [Actinobacteria bacterium YIM 96077]RAW13218.1 xanthine dehydrogenase family protein subunit M [Phytoactinopolyspora halophila]
MKPSGFTYHRPQTVDEALDVLGRVGPEGKVLAGGQSLVPMMNMRLAAPAELIDINRLTALDYVQVEGDGAGAAVRVGATARHTTVERDTAAFTVLPLLRQALSHVAHSTIRNQGTTVGSLVHADPAGEMTAVLALLDGSVEVRSAHGARCVSASDFFVGPLESCLEPDELATSAVFPVPEGRSGSAWLEVARRHGDYAVCGVGAVLRLDGDARVVAARTGYISVDATPVVLDLGEVIGRVPYDTADWDAAGRYAAAQLQPEGDIHASAAYRRQLAGVLTSRALSAAARHALARHDIMTEVPQ